MHMLARLFETGRIIDVILILVIVEAGLLILFWQRTGRGIAPRALIANLVSGSALMVAVRLALTEAPWTAVAACLTISFIAHVVDLAGRWHS